MKLTWKERIVGLFTMACVLMLVLIFFTCCSHMEASAVNDVEKAPKLDAAVFTVVNDVPYKEPKVDEKPTRTAYSPIKEKAEKDEELSEEIPEPVEEPEYEPEEEYIPEECYEPETYEEGYADSYENGSGLTPESGVNYYEGRKETYYSSNVLVHNRIGEWTAGDDGVYRDSDGYVVVAASDISMGETVNTSFGPGKVYDTGCDGGVTDIYVNW